MEQNGTERNGMEPEGTLWERQAREALAGLDIPDPASDLTFLGVRVHEIDGPRKERLLLAFGLVSLRLWLEVVAAYNASFGEKPPYDPESDSTLMDALNRLHYYRVGYEPVGSDFRIRWDTFGVVPVTLWEVAPRG